MLLRSRWQWAVQGRLVLPIRVAGPLSQAHSVLHQEMQRWEVAETLSGVGVKVIKGLVPM